MSFTQEPHVSSNFSLSNEKYLQQSRVPLGAVFGLDSTKLNPVNMFHFALPGMKIRIDLEILLVDIFTFVYS